MSFQENKEENSPSPDENEDLGELNDSAESNVSAQEHKAEDLPVPPQTDHDKIESLEAELASVNAKLVETHNKMLRIAADADNSRKRFEKEKMDTRLYCIQEFARDLLPVSDALEKGLQMIEESNENSAEQNAQSASVAEGVKLVSKIFHDVTKKHGIERLPGKGTPFNPMYHNAIAKEAGSDYKSETVIEEFLPGYKIGDRILRTALVKVGAPD